jgi:2,3-diketo-5-methylthio-1-phosphopentane phosphatase
MHTTPVLVSDFDGTITRHDFYRLVLDELDDPQVEGLWQAYLDGKLTHFAALQRMFAALRLETDRAVELVRRMEPAPGLRRAVLALQRAGWEIVVASAGCAWYIDQILGALDLELTVYSNPGTYSPSTGLLMTPHDDSPFQDPDTGVDKLAIVREALARSERVAFAGDGPPDAAPARLVPAELRFARGEAARRLAAAGEDYVPFEVWTDIADHLLSPQQLG